MSKLKRFGSRKQPLRGDINLEKPKSHHNLRSSFDYEARTRIPVPSSIHLQNAPRRRTSSWLTPPIRFEAGEYKKIGHSWDSERSETPLKYFKKCNSSLLPRSLSADREIGRNGQFSEPSSYRRAAKGSEKAPGSKPKQSSMHHRKGSKKSTSSRGRASGGSGNEQRPSMPTETHSMATEITEAERIQLQNGIQPSKSCRCDVRTARRGCGVSFNVPVAKEITICDSALCSPSTDPDQPEQNMREQCNPKNYTDCTQKYSSPESPPFDNSPSSEPDHREQKNPPKQPQKVKLNYSENSPISRAPSKKSDHPAQRDLPKNPPQTKKRTQNYHQEPRRPVIVVPVGEGSTRSKNRKPKAILSSPSSAGSSIRYARPLNSKRSFIPYFRNKEEHASVFLSPLPHVDSLKTLQERLTGHQHHDPLFAVPETTPPPAAMTCINCATITDISKQMTDLSRKLEGFEHGQLPDIRQQVSRLNGTVKSLSEKCEKNENELKPATAPDPIQESNRQDNQEAMQPDQESNQELNREPNRQPDQEHDRQPDQESNQELNLQPNQEHDRVSHLQPSSEPSSDPNSEPNSEPDHKPILKERKSLNRCEFCRRRQLPQLTSFHNQLKQTMGDRSYTDVVMSIFLRADNIYHVNVRDINENRSLACFLVTDEGMVEAHQMGLFREILTFSVIDVRNTLPPKNFAMGFTFELVEKERKKGGCETVDDDELSTTSKPFVARLLDHWPLQLLRHVYTD